MSNIDRRQRTSATTARTMMGVRQRRGKPRERRVRCQRARHEPRRATTPMVRGESKRRRQRTNVPAWQARSEAERDGTTEIAVRSTEGFFNRRMGAWELKEACRRTGDAARYAETGPAREVTRAGFCRFRRAAARRLPQPASGRVNL